MNRPSSKPPFTSTWSLVFPSGASPAARTGQCSIYDEDTDSLIIAYGIDSRGQHLNDMWALDLRTFTWRQISSELRRPRTNARAVKFQREMLVFGGCTTKKKKHGKVKYLADLHAINLDTGTVTVFDSSRVMPRENACLFISDTSLFVWSGYNGADIIEFAEFRFADQSWIVQELNTESGRRAASFLSYQNSQFDFIFGSTRGHPLSRFDKQIKQIEVMKCLGTAPPPELLNAMLTIAGNFLFVFGGEMEKSAYSYLYALDLNKLYWFPFYISPDNDTTSYEDGEVTNQGIFKLPRQNSGAFAYSPRTRSLVCSMGSLLIEPVPLSVIYIGNALAILNHRSDLLNMLDF